LFIYLQFYVGKKDKPQRFIVLIISNNKLLVINFLRNFLSLNQEHSLTQKLTKS